MLICISSKRLQCQAEIRSDLQQIPSVTASEAGRAQTENLRNCSLSSSGHFETLGKVCWNAALGRVTAPSMPEVERVRPDFYESSCLGLQL
eukprot:gene15826-33379_t